MKVNIPVMLVVSVMTSLSYSANDVTHEDIREAILSLVRMYRDSVDKLERHEYRERHLGEQLKKSLAGLDKRHRTLDLKAESITALLSKLDERLSTVEAVMLQKGEREENQQDRILNAINGLQGSLHSWMKTLEEMIRSQKPNTDKSTGDWKNQIHGLETSVNTLSNHVSSAVQKLSNQSKNKNPEDNDKLKSIHDKLTVIDTKWNKALLDIERLYLGYETLMEDAKKETEITKPVENDWHPVFLTALESQTKEVLEMKKLTEVIVNDVNKLPTKKEIQVMNNMTLDSLQEMKYEITANTDRGIMKIDGKLAETQKILGRGQEELLKSVSDSGLMAESLYGDVTKSYEQLLKEVKGLAQVEQVMIQTADNVMDTKRRIEYGVHQILLEVGDLVKIQGKELNSTVNHRFDNISATILDNQLGTMSNLSSKIETEISQVWRQIGIMYQQLTASGAALDRLQLQTESYVNGSLQTMDSMEGKVGQITGRMSEVDENLNFLLGRLSLVTQEFNLIKSGLASALDSIRDSFLEVQNQIKVVDSTDSTNSKDRPLKRNITSN